jgi:hypothetical protein
MVTKKQGVEDDLSKYDGNRPQIEAFNYLFPINFHQVWAKRTT